MADTTLRTYPTLRAAFGAPLESGVTAPFTYLRTTRVALNFDSGNTICAGEH